jgi:hypothetical protein
MHSSNSSSGLKSGSPMTTWGFGARTLQHAGSVQGVQVATQWTTLTPALCSRHHRIAAQTSCTEQHSTPAAAAPELTRVAAQAL